MSHSRRLDEDGGAVHEVVDEATDPVLRLLKQFTEAVVVSNGLDALGIAAARKALVVAIGEVATVAAAAVIAQFDGINKLADMTGCQYDKARHSAESTAKLTGLLALEPPKYVASPAPTASRL